MKTPHTPISYPAHIAAIQPYTPGAPASALARRLGLAPEAIVKLASNENPLGASPRAMQALADAACDLSLYPDNDCTDLVNALAGFHGVDPEWIVVGAGSESVLGNAVSTLLGVGRCTVYAQYSFQAYVNAVQRVGAEHVVVPSPDFTVDLDGLRRALACQPSVVYIANPGNPTGTCLGSEALAAFLAQVPPEVVVVLDEAYVEFMPQAQQADALAWVRRYPNLLVTRTFSKAYGLAGLRIGYGVAQPGLADMLRRVRAPFTVTALAQCAAVAALEDQAFLAATLESNRQGHAILTAGLDALGIRYLDSQTNFVLAEVGDGAALARRLEQRGWIVRPVGGYGLPRWVRISIGQPDTMHALVQVLQAACRE